MTEQPLQGRYRQASLEVHYGPGAVAGLERALAAEGVERALVVTGTTLATKTDLVERVRAAAGGRVAGVFHETVQHVHRPTVLAGAAAARAVDADALISFGGGSPNDTMKAVAMCLAEGIADGDRLDAMRMGAGGRPRLSGQAPPTFAIPTTLSAGEFTAFFGVTHEVRRVKDLFGDPQLNAKAIFLDPELTLATPERLWLSTGMRAVDHCVEAIASRKAHPFTSALAKEALTMLNRSLRRTRTDPGDLAARTESLLAAWMSVAGLNNVTVGLSHAIGHQLGGLCDVPHGITSCITMHPVMRYNAEQCAAAHAQVAAALGVSDAADGVRDLVLALGLPHRLSEVGVGPDRFAELADATLTDGSAHANPRKVAGPEEIVAILEQVR
ncbi:MAG: iron-containing alcohol dehydrogenase [Acidimicrobiales bacterium]